MTEETGRDAAGDPSDEAPPARTRRTVIVAGAGIIGILSALEIQSRGHDVVLVDPGPPGGEQAASFGNGSWLSPASIMPMSVPGLWKKIPGYLADPGGPFVIRWRHLPSLMPWLIRFLHAGATWRKTEICAANRYRLCRDTVEGHLAWARQAGVDHLIERRGLLFVYHQRSDFLGEQREWTMRRSFGIRFTEYEDDELRAIEPHLCADYRFGVRVNDGAFVTDTKRYCEGLVALFEQRGGRVVNQTVRDFVLRANRLVAVATDRERLPCERAVISAGAWSGDLARRAGDRVPLISERGYHVVLADVIHIPSHSMMPHDGKMVLTPTAGGLRIAGQVELASLTASPNWNRASILLGFGRKMFPTVVAGPPTQVMRRWMGHRPSTPDGLPSIGPASRCPDIVHAFGHGHSGMTQAPATARIVRAIIDEGRVPAGDEVFSPGRF